MKINYVKYPSKNPWCSDFATEYIKKYSINEIIPIEIKDIGKYSVDIIHFHNIQLYDDSFHKKLSDNKIKITAGIRGKIGLNQKKHVLKHMNALAVNIDPLLQKKTLSFHENCYVIPEGIDTKIFFPNNNYNNDFYVGWVGSDHKDFKNAKFLKKIGFNFRKATYKKYIPHYKMPEFYWNCNVIVNFSEHEGFCRPIAEAASCGLPVISNDVGVARYILDSNMIIEGSPRKKFEEYKNKIEYLNKFPTKAIKIGMKNRKKSLDFDWEKIVPLYDKMWGSIK